MDSILAGIAQLVEHRIRNAKVSGSIPLSGKLIVNYYHGNIMPINVFKKKL